MLLTLENVKKNYGDKAILEDISFTVAEGEFISIIGPSGHGKTTLLHLLAKLSEPTQGKIAYESKNSKPILIFQEYNKTLFPWKTALQNIEFVLHHLSPKERRDQALKYIKLVHLEDAIEKYPSQLSGGMQQRVAIARALAYEPKILLMDEPFGSIDAHVRRQLELELLSIWSNPGLKVTILFVTHDIDEAIFLSSKILILKGKPATIIDEISISLPYPRDLIETKSTQLFNNIRVRILKQILN